MGGGTILGPLPGCVTSGKLLNLSEPLFLNLPNDGDVTWDKGVRELLPESNYIIVVEMLWKVGGILQRYFLFIIHLPIPGNSLKPG